MADCARGFGTDGFAVCLDGLHDRRGRPIVYSHGLPRGTRQQIERQTVYLQERVLAGCTSGGGERGGGCAALIIVDCKKPSFRQPDAALRKGGIDVVIFADVVFSNDASRSCDRSAWSRRPPKPLRVPTEQ